MTSENHTQFHQSKLNVLPLFASDKELADAIVGKAHAARWIRDALPTLEAKGFPPIDKLHGGRPVPLVVRFYERIWMGLRWETPAAAPPGAKDRLGQWKGARKTYLATKKARLKGADGS